MVWSARTRIETGAGPEALRWASEERSPEAGRRKRIMKEAVRKLQTAWLGWHVDGGDTLCHVAKEVARYDADKEEWTRRQGWDAFSCERHRRACDAPRARRAQ